ncbi:hypothetical protein K7432_009375 [Basidiobolus ranarum]|uniref:Uncharacterized protein n=1 Tax=Basidiobolus ranarum TaxID=34480 RepID=A0ABR2VX72_9FUNG
MVNAPYDFGATQSDALDVSKDAMLSAHIAAEIRSSIAADQMTAKAGFQKSQDCQKALL